MRLNSEGIHDESGRWIAPPQPPIAERPAGVWDTNRDTRVGQLVVVCAWCQAVICTCSETWAQESRA